jgi:hypothetical protein
VNADGSTRIRAPRADPVREAQVVADRQAHLDAVPRPGGDDLAAGRGDRRLPIHAPTDLHVEQVNLAVHGAQLAVGARVDRGVGEPVLLALKRLDQRSGHQVDRQLARDLPRPGDRLPVERLGGRPHVIVGAQTPPLLGKDHQLGARIRRSAHEPIGSTHVAGDILGRVELDGGRAHWVAPSGRTALD